MKNVITYGSFDLFHIGHYILLKRASLLGNLYVGVSTDEFNKLKGKQSYWKYEQRADLISNLRFVSFVFPEKTWEQKIDDIKKYKIDIFVMGDDWKGKFDYLRSVCDVLYFSRTPGISSTIIKEVVKRDSEK